MLTRACMCCGKPMAKDDVVCPRCNYLPGPGAREWGDIALPRCFVCDEECVLLDDGMCPSCHDSQKVRDQ